MKIEITKSFEKESRQLPQNIRKKLQQLLYDISETSDLFKISSIKQLKTNAKENRICFRARIGDYRAGFILTDQNTVRMIVVGHRGDIYKRFP